MDKAKTLFDVIGPVMIGPSSSHTAGAVRIGYLAGKIFGESDFTASQRPSGELIPSNSNKTSAIKIGRGSSNSKVSKRSGGIKKIRFQSN